MIFLNSECWCNYRGIDEECRRLERYFYSLISAGLAKVWKKPQARVLMMTKCNLAKNSLQAGPFSFIFEGPPNFNWANLKLGLSCAGNYVLSYLKYMIWTNIPAWAGQWVEKPLKIASHAAMAHKAWAKSVQMQSYTYFRKWIISHVRTPRAAYLISSL